MGDAPRYRRVWFVGSGKRKAHAELPVGRRPDRDGYWVAWLGDDGKIKKRGFPSKADAERGKRAIERWLNAWLHPGHVDTPWADACIEYGATLTTASPKHQLEVARILGVMRNRYSVDRVSRFTATVAEQFIGSLAARSPETRRRARAVLHAFGEYLATHGHLAANPIRHVRRVKLERAEPKPADEMAWLKLLSACSDPAAELHDAQAWYVLIMLAYVSGLRQSAMLRLRPGDIELGDASTNHIGLINSYTLKTKKRKPIGLPQAVTNRLATRLFQLPDGTAYLFPWRTFQVKAWKRLRKIAGVAVRFHSLRGSAGTQAALARLEAAGAEQLDHHRADTFATHYADRARLARAVAEQLALPELPPMPDYSEDRPAMRRTRRGNSE